MILFPERSFIPLFFVHEGVWLLHYHFDSHFVWGMTTIFIVKDGPINETSMLPPPPYMPKCEDLNVMDDATAYHSFDH